MITVPVFYIPLAVAGLILLCLGVRSYKTIWRWTVNRYHHPPFGILLIICLVAFGVCVIMTTVDEAPERATSKQAQTESHLRSILPGQWYDLYADIRYINYFETKLAMIEKFAEIHAKDEPPLPCQGFDKFLADMDHKKNGWKDRISRAKKMLYPFLQVVEKRAKSDARNPYYFLSEVPREGSGNTYLSWTSSL